MVLDIGLFPDLTGSCQIWQTHQILYFFEIYITGCHWEFSQCHMASNHWSTSTIVPSPCHVSVQSANSTCHIIVQTSMSAYHINTTSIYRLPHGTILLVPEMNQKCQILVTRGSLWCCHITIITSC
jgi:hypothetical protein